MTAFPPNPHVLLFGRAAALVAAAFLASCGDSEPSRKSTAAPEEVPRHVIFVVVDTLRADALGCYGAPGLEEAGGIASATPTPVFDALSRRGTRFENVESASSWTVSSTVAFFSGLDPLQHGANSKLVEAIPDNIPFLTVAMKDAGFKTAAFISNPMLGPKLGFDRGFDKFVRADRRAAKPTIDEALSWTREAMAADPDAPLFLYVHLFDPHWPYVPADEEQSRFALAPSPLSDKDQVRYGSGMVAGNAEATTKLLDWCSWAKIAYSCCVTTADRETGRLLAGLEEIGIDDNALIVVTSDHGEEFGEHGAIGHARQLYAESLRVPLIVAGPGVPQGATVTEPVELRHLATTIVSRMGLYGQSPLRGPDLLEQESRQNDAGPEHVASVEFALWPKDDDAGFRLVQYLTSIRSGRERLIWGHNYEFEEGSGVLVTLGEDGYPEGVRAMGKSDSELPLMQSLRARWSEARSIESLKGGADLEVRRAELEQLGYFGASESIKKGGRRKRRPNK